MFHPGTGIQLGEELLLKSNVPQYRASFDLIYHPAFMSYAVDFHQRVSVDHLGCLDLCLTKIFGYVPTCCRPQNVSSMYLFIETHQSSCLFSNLKRPVIDQCAARLYSLVNRLAGKTRREMWY